MSTTDTRIYVACLSSYNAGVLHGRWIDAAQDVDAIEAEIAEMLAESKHKPAEDWAIHDTDGLPDIGEWECLERVSELACAIDVHGDAVAEYWAYDEPPDGELLDRFTEAYCGQWDSERSYAEHLADEGCFGDIPPHLVAYIDYDAMARDLFCGDYYRTEGGHVFRCL